MDMLTLHRDPSRHAWFAAHESDPIFFDNSLKCWNVIEPRQAEAMLTARELGAIPYAATYEDLAKLTGDGFPNLIFAFRHIPLCSDDEMHRLARRRMAHFVASRRAVVADAIPALVERSAARLDQPGEVEIMAEVLEPLVLDLISTLIAVDVTQSMASCCASAIFDRMIGLRKRRELEGAIGSVRTMIRAAIGPDAPDEEEGLRLALLALGHDALLGTLGESLYRLITAHPGSPLSAIPYPPDPPETGVPYIERIVRQPFHFAGVDLAPGERVRIRIQSFAYTKDAADRTRMFGAGIHTCLGRQMSLDLWQALTARLGRIHRVATSVSYAARDNDYVFTVPQHLVLRIENDL